MTEQKVSANQLTVILISLPLKKTSLIDYSLSPNISRGLIFELGLRICIGLKNSKKKFSKKNSKVSRVENKNRYNTKEKKIRLTFEKNLQAYCKLLIIKNIYFYISSA